MGRKRLPPRIRANRLNARKSTGPRTEAGKKRSSQNAILHGLSAQQSSEPLSPEVEEFAQFLIEGDEGPEVLDAARELAQAQRDLNLIRHYRLILKRLKQQGLSMPLPESELRNHPVICELIDFVTSREPHYLGVPDKKDLRLYDRVINFIYRENRQSKDPERESMKLDRYEKLALRRRRIAIAKLDEARGLRISRSPQISLPSPDRFKSPGAVAASLVPRG
jgi:hypothetical protein